MYMQIDICIYTYVYVHMYIYICKCVCVCASVICTVCHSWKRIESMWSCRICSRSLCTRV